jgi:hypothetical protein
MRTILSIICFVSLAAVISSFSGGIQNSATKKISLVFHHQVGNETLILGEPVKNISGETISVEKFKYYVSNFSVTNDKGAVTKLPAQYFLVDEADSASKNINLLIPGNMIVTRVSFLLGVDSIKNVSGIQTGALDPLKGMFWTWNSGYIMAKMEGSSASAATAGNRFTYEIGGFRKGMNTIKHIELAIDYKGKELEEIHINADLNHWFKGNTELKISETPICHSPGALAMRIADNYSSMFSINSIR